MVTRRRVLLVTHEAETVSAVRSALGENGTFARDCVCPDLNHLVLSMERQVPEAVLVDVDAASGRTLAHLEPIIGRFKDTRFIVLAADRQAELLLEAMQVGARHVVEKSAIPVDLAGVLRRLIPGGPAQASTDGSVFTLLSAGGGCGSTTLAVNLANELSLAERQAALIVDLDACFGAVAGYLGLEGQYGLADLLADPDRLDGELIRSTAISYSRGLEALISPASTPNGKPGWLDFGRLRDVLSLCRRAYRHTVVDAPRAPLDLAAQLAHASDATLIVMQLNVKDVRYMQSLIGGLKDRGVHADRILPVVNRYHKRHSMVTLDEAKAAIGRIPLVQVRNDYKSAVRGMNYGRPLEQAAPHSRLRRDVRALAARLSSVYASRTTVAIYR